MAKTYFRNLPDFSYVNRISDTKNVSEYINVKNFFRRAKLRPDIIGSSAFFETYIVLGDERPDKIAYDFYDDSNLDWIVLLSNNILNIQSEWPLTQRSFDRYMLEKYGSYENMYAIHHYESKEVKNSLGGIMLKKGLRVQSDHKVSFWDIRKQNYITITDCAREVTNYEYEENLNNKKREIYLLKPEYLRIAIDDLENILPYKKGTTQYESDTLKSADNIRLYQ